MSRVNAFSYCPDSAEFSVGGEQFGVNELEVGFGNLARETETDCIEIDRLIKQTPLVHGLSRPIMLPKMHEWLNENRDSQTLQAEVTEVIGDVFEKLHPDRVIQKGQDRGFIGFNMFFASRELPHPTLQTLGNCACMGVTESNPLGNKVWVDEVASFTFHNVDTREQHISLLAGLGYLAHRASRSE